MKFPLKTTLAACTLLLGGQAMAQITLYQNEGWRGRAVSISSTSDDLRRVGFNDRASSVVVEKGRWEVCEDAGFRGQCRILKRGSYESLAGMGLNDRVSSVRAVRGNRYSQNEAPPPLPQASYEYRQRPNERTYEARVTSVRAVVGPPEQRCWVERQQVQDSRPNTGGMLAGAILGGVLGHQIGGGTGRDIATVGGALAGGAVGANAGRSNNTYGQDVRRCENVANATPQYWDVTYEYRGVEHRTQLAAAPGEYIPVNRDGVPRM
ncbi:glycine zipper 2TM domain-containing protein [Massilia sp. FT127W]|uniref:Glycine zipper 2TM domain-containing protein n=2 Tax=Pseudoduganella aquatica TaxID=2660641 RepID=A0A7X4KJD0_9BURK|nr:glycine zipper 2TM domain-containing protein [Pseudoduganella aquatica]